jgi:hypothetical protein
MISLCHSVDGWSDQWKVLVLDTFCMDVLSPLLTVADLRKLGVTLHMNINDKREEVPDVPAVYFVMPSMENIRRIGEDLKAPLYKHVYINFASMVSRSQLESLAVLAVENSATTLIKKVLDQYMNFVALEPKLFSLNIKGSFTRYNRSGIDEAGINEYMDVVVEGLFAAVATMGVVPIIRAKAGTAAEMVATKLDKKIKDHLSTGTSLFTDRGATSFSRPVLLVVDREMDYVTMLHHCSTYQALVHDLLDIKNNSVNVTVKRGAAAGGPNKKTYHLDYDADDFWKKYSGASFPDAVQNNDKELQAISVKEGQIRAATSGGGEDSRVDVNAGMKDLLQVTDSLPQLLEQKKKLEMHTNILSATMDKIAKREIPSFYEVEEAIVLSGAIADKAAFEDLVKTANKGSVLDKLRLLCVALLAADVDDVPSFEKALSTLLEAPESTTDDGTSIADATFALGAIQFIKKHRAFNRPKKAAAPSITIPDNPLASNALNMGLNLASGFLAKATAQVKSFIPGNRHLPVTTVLDAVMENNPTSTVAEPFIYLDPKYRGGKGTAVPRQNTPFKEGIVFAIGGGCYAEYQNIQDYANASTLPRQVVYGCTELLNSTGFLQQLAELSS